VIAAHQRSTSIGAIVTVSERIYRRIIVGQWSVILGLLFGAVVMPGALDVWRANERARLVAYERATPVVTMTGSIVRRDGDAVFVHIAGTKHRECKYLGLQAYSVDATGRQHDANIKRVDVDERGDTKAPGVYDIGVWRVWPVREWAASTVIRSLHDCNGVTVSTVIANVGL